MAKFVLNDLTPAMHQKITFIVNPISGDKDKSAILGTICRHLDIGRFAPEFLITEKGGDAEAFARESTADIVVAVGGDGTVNEVARGLIGSNKALGIIPCGSGDGLALHLGISRDIRRAVTALNEGCRIAIDTADINGKPFFCTAGFGLDAAVSLEFARSSRRGLSQYIALAWEEWKNYPADRYSVYTRDGLIWSGDAVIVTVANVNQWGNYARIAPMASLQDGLLDLIIVGPFSSLEIPDLALRLLAGKAQTSRHYLHFTAPFFRIHRESGKGFHFDGEPSKGGKDFELSVRPGALHAIVSSSKTRSI